MMLQNEIQEGAQIVPDGESVQKTLSIIELIGSGGTAGMVIIAILFVLLVFAIYIYFERLFAIKAACGAFDLGTFGVFLTIVSCGTTFGGLTGYAMNAARDTAPRLAFAILPIKGKGDADWAYGLTAPLIGPVIGALVAVAVYAALPL